MKFTTFASLLSFALSASAANVDVDVGEDGLTFNPSDIKCSSGDTVTFHFYPGGHSVVSSDFNKPCTSNGMINSGTINSDSGESKQVFVVNCPSATTYLFCAQFGHCKTGMVAAINAPSSGNTLASYKSAAAKSSDSQGPINGVSGGKVTTAGSGSSESSSSGGSKSSSEPQPSPPPPENTMTPAASPAAPALSTPASSPQPTAPAMSSEAPAVASPAPSAPAAAPSGTPAPAESSSEEAPAAVMSTMSIVYNPPAQAPVVPAANATFTVPTPAAEATASGTAAPSQSSPPAATGNDASSYASSIGVVLLVALANALFMV